MRVPAHVAAALVRVQRLDDDDLGPARRARGDEPPRDRHARRLVAVDAADDEHPACGPGVAEDDRPDRAALDAVTDRQRREEQSQHAHLRAIRSQDRERPANTRLDLGDDLLRRAAALRRAALHVALEVLRAVLAGEVDVPLLHLLVPGERRVLPDLPVRVPEG